jgi:hypothetical protein
MQAAATCVLQSLPSVTASRREHGGLHASPLRRAVAAREHAPAAAEVMAARAHPAEAHCILSCSSSRDRRLAAHHLPARRVAGRQQDRHLGSPPASPAAPSALAPGALRRKASRRRLQLARTPEETSAAQCWSLNEASDASRSASAGRTPHSRACDGFARATRSQKLCRAHLPRASSPSGSQRRSAAEPPSAAPSSRATAPPPPRAPVRMRCKASVHLLSSCSGCAQLISQQFRVRSRDASCASDSCGLAPEERSEALAGRLGGRHVSARSRRPRRENIASGSAAGCV